MNQEPKSQEEELAELKKELMSSLKPYAFKEDFTLQDLVDELDGSDKKPQSARVFKSARERYANARSTAFTFIFIGILGLATSILPDCLLQKKQILRMKRCISENTISSMSF